MFPGGGLSSFTSTMWVIKTRGGVMFGPLLLQSREQEHAGGSQVSSCRWDVPHPLCAGSWAPAVMGVGEQGLYKVREVKPTGSWADFQHFPKSFPIQGCGKRLLQAVPGCRAAVMLACQPEINTAACRFINILTLKARGCFTADMALSESRRAAESPMHPAEHPCCGSAAAREHWVTLGFAP